MCNVNNLINDESQTADLLMFMASMASSDQSGKTITDFETWLDGLPADIQTNNSFRDTMIAANRIHWFLREDQEQTFLAQAITDHVHPDIMAKAQTFYDILKSKQPKAFVISPEVRPNYKPLLALYKTHTT